MLTHEFWYAAGGRRERGKEKKSSYNMSDVGEEGERNPTNQINIL